MPTKTSKIAMALGLVLLVGCDEPPDGKIYLRYMAWGNPEQVALERAFCERFNRENPDLKVTFFQVPGSSYLNKAIVMMASRTAPDVLRIDHYNFPSLVKKDYFLDMSPYANADKDFRASDFFPRAIEEGYYQKHLYGMSVLFGGILIYYNKSMVKAAGLEDPYELSQRGEWTWEKFRTHAIAMTKFDDRKRAVRFGCAIPGFPATTAAVWGFGGDLLSPDGKKSLVGEPAAVKGYQFLADLRYVDHCAPTPSQAANAQFTFESGKLGMQFDWMGMAPRLRTVIKDFEWDVCPIPAGPVGKATLVKGNQLVIYRESPHPEAAWRFVKFLTSPEIERALYVENRRSVPTRQAIAHSKEYLKSEFPPFHNDVFIRSIEGGRSLPITDRWSEWTTALLSEHDLLFSGQERDAGVVMRRAARKIDEVLADEEGY